MKPLYKVIDFYEFNQETILKTDNVIQAINALNQRILDTDGECAVYVFKLNADGKTYSELKSDN